MSQLIPTWQAEIETETEDHGPSLRRIVIVSLAIIGIGFGSFFAWAFMAPLDSAVPANGTIVVNSKRKTISVLDSGILRELYVTEGSRVEQGQPLLQLDGAQVQSQLGSLKVQYWSSVGKLARLRAEQREETTIDFPPDLVEAAATDPGLADLMANEQNMLRDRLNTYHGTQAVQEKKINQLHDQISSFRAQEAAMKQRLVYTEQELTGVNELFASGFATKTRLLELKRSQAELIGNVGELRGKSAEAEQVIAQTQLEKLSAENQRKQDISKDLQEAQSSAADLAERIHGSEDTVAKKLVIAPEAGTVTDIKFFTPGSSIVAGQPILDIVPLDDRMVVEANVRPEDIENVHPGQKINIRLTAYKANRVPVLTGKLVYVSADRQQDQKGVPFFLARAEIDGEALAGLKGVTLYPGMPAEVLIIGGERKAIDYFISPITRSLERAFRED
jgi:HlyD family secretion protein